MYTFTPKQIKQILARARQLKARVHVGMNGIQPNTLKAFINAFDGTCVRPTPSNIIRVKVHDTYTGDVKDLIQILELRGNAVFVKQDGHFLIFWRPPKAN